jgi:hypothetical protein
MDPSDPPPPYILPAAPSPSAPMFPMCVHCGYGSSEPVKNLSYPCGYFHYAHVRCHAYYTTNTEGKYNCIVCNSENCSIVVYDSSEPQMQPVPVENRHMHHIITLPQLSVAFPIQKQQDRCVKNCVYIYVSFCCILISGAITGFIYMYYKV